MLHQVLTRIKKKLCFFHCGFSSFQLSVYLLASEFSEVECVARPSAVDSILHPDRKGWTPSREHNLCKLFVNVGFPVDNVEISVQFFLVFLYSISMCYH